MEEPTSRHSDADEGGEDAWDWEDALDQEGDGDESVESEEEKDTFHRRSQIGAPSCLVFVLHGYRMRARDMRTWLFEDVEALRPRMEFVHLRSGVLPIANEGGKLRRAWFEYLTDYDGATEDVTDADTLTRTRARLVDEIEGLCEDRGVPLQRVAVVGYSQGGNVAVDLACHLRVGLCVTLASHKLSVTDRPIHCRWNALMLSRDECFPMDTFAPLVAEASTVDVLDDYHGMDACGEEAIAFLEGVLDAFAPAMPDGILEIEERPEEQKRHTDVSCPAPASL